MSDKSKPAFPLDGGDVSNGGTGMTLREYYAGLAMQGLITHDPVSTSILSDPNGRDLRKWIAADAVGFADALIAELQREAEDE